MTHPSPLPGGDNNLIQGVIDKIENIKRIIGNYVVVLTSEEISNPASCSGIPIRPEILLGFFILFYLSLNGKALAIHLNKTCGDDCETVVGRLWGLIC